MSFLKIGWVALAGAMALLGPLSAQAPAARAIQLKPGTRQPSGQETRVALVIGNGAYPEAPLRNPASDARAMKAVLEACGFEVTLLTEASKRDMEIAIRNFGDRIRNGAVGLFYFAGHGVQVRGINYLIPVGANLEREDEVTYQAVEAGQVLDKMDSAKNRLNIMILDACRNNPFSRSWRGAGDRGLAQVNAPTGSFIAFATAPGREAADGAGEHGLYTEALLAELREPGVELEKVFKKARERVMAASEGRQTPWESNSTVGDFFFVPSAKGVPQPETPGQNFGVRGALGPPPEAIALLGGLQVIVNAAGTKVYVDGKARGEASPTQALNLADLPAGEVRVRVEAPGYLPREQPFTIQEGQWVQARVVLVKPSGEALPAPPSAAVQAQASGPLQNRFGMVFARIPAGRFTMGDNAGVADEKPEHPVQITRAFAMQATPVTVKQWKVFVDATKYLTTMENYGGIFIQPSRGITAHVLTPFSWRDPGFRQQEDHPVVCVSWEDAQAFIHWLNQEDPGNSYRLPTEAEWEYACRAGSAEQRPEAPDKIAWYWSNSGSKTHPVGQKLPNPWGLYDMLGNASQLCQDWYDMKYYARSLELDPQGPAKGPFRVTRGGGWDLAASNLRPGFRNDPNNDEKFSLGVGFRLVMTLP